MLQPAHCMKCALLLVALLAVYRTDSVAQPLEKDSDTSNTTSSVDEVSLDGLKNDTVHVDTSVVHVNLTDGSGTLDGNATASVHGLTVIETGERSGENATAEISRFVQDLLPDFGFPDFLGKSQLKREAENGSSFPLEFRPFPFFPPFPFFFPRENDLAGLKGEETSANGGDGSSSNGGKPDDTVAGGPGPKPFIFFKFALNIREIPLANLTSSDRSNDSKIINVKRFTFDNLGPGGSDSSSSSGNDIGADANAEDDSTSTSKEVALSENGRRRRNTKGGKDANGFFDDFSLFPDADADEFFPKTDLFLPDLLFHRTPLRKLSRRKRNERGDLKQRKLQFRNDVKFLMDMFDDAFAKTKRELERTSPILEFLRGTGDAGLKRKEDGASPFGLGPTGRSPTNERPPKLKWKIERNVKRLADAGGDEGSMAMRGDDSPVIILDKIVKTGEVRLRDDPRSLFRSRRKRRGHLGNLRRADDDSRAETDPKGFRTLFKDPGSGTSRPDEDESAEVEPAVRTPVNDNEHDDDDSGSSSSSNFDDGGAEAFWTTPIASNETGDKVADSAKVQNKSEKVVNLIRRVVNSSENILNYTEGLIRVIGTLENQMKATLTENQKLLKRDMASGKQGANHTQKPIYDDLKQNITKVLDQFLTSFKRLDELGPTGGDAETDSFDWTEKETLQSSDLLSGRSKKHASDFVGQYLEKETTERRVADLNYLFLTVTLPTVVVSAFILLVCFFSLQVKGKLCKKLFQPRRVLVVEDETRPQYPVENVDKSNAVPKY